MEQDHLARYETMWWSWVLSSIRKCKWIPYGRKSWVTSFFMYLRSYMCEKFWFWIKMEEMMILCSWTNCMDKICDIWFELIVWIAFVVCQYYLKWCLWVVCIAVLHWIGMNIGWIWMPCLWITILCATLGNGVELVWAIGFIKMSMYWNGVLVCSSCCIV